MFGYTQDITGEQIHCENKQIFVFKVIEGIEKSANANSFSEA